MKYFKQTLFTLLLLMLTNTVIAAEDKKIDEKAFEGEPAVIFIGKSLTGAMQLKACEDCPIIKLKITPDTKAFFEMKSVPLSSMVDTTDKPKLTLYDVNTKIVTRLFWYPR